ncbi:MAG: amidase family protein [Defluviitaleaceae bacterium]|nr:amidase family protein [Defluviitaleaceae bacterium]
MNKTETEILGDSPKINKKYALPAQHVITLAEEASGFARYDGVRFGHRSENAANLESLYINSRTEIFGDETKKRILLGTFLLSAGNIDTYYKKAVIVRQKIKDDFPDEYARIFEREVRE